VKAKKLSSNELLLVRNRARNRIKEQIAYSIFAIFLVFVAPVFPFSRRGVKTFPNNLDEYLNMLSGYAMITGLILLLYWVQNIYLNDIIFKRKIITDGEIENWIKKKNSYGDITYELIVKTTLGSKENYLTFEKHIKYFEMGEKYQFHVSKNSKVLVNIAKIKNKDRSPD
jgi:hypothetical protein